MIQDAKDITELRTLRLRRAREEGKPEKDVDLSDLPQIPDRYRTIAAATTNVNDLRNMYDLGLWNNVLEVIWPRSMRPPSIPARNDVLRGAVGASGGRKIKRN